MKKRFGLLNPAPAEVDAVVSSIHTIEHVTLSRELARKAITLIRDPQGLIPLKPNVETMMVETAAVRDLTRSLGLQGMTLVADTQITDVLHAAENGQVAIVPINDLNTNKEQLKLIEDLVKVGNPVIVIAHRNPFDAALLPENVTVLITYGFNPPIRDALADVLSGKIQPSGTLPVTLP
jgi:beta-N-acetylhexosaminidase